MMRRRTTLQLNVVASKPSGYRKFRILACATSDESSCKLRAVVQATPAVLLTEILPTRSPRRRYLFRIAGDARTGLNVNALIGRASNGGLDLPWPYSIDPRIDYCELP